MHRKLGLIGILLGLSIAFGATSAWAQAQAGSIFVKAVDEQGAAVPGATVTVTGPVLPRPLTGVTDSTGVHRFPTLSVGTYSVKVTLAGFQTVNREGVVVVQSQTVTLDFALKVSSLSEEITVRGETPVVDTKSATVATNLDSKLLENTPGGKDIWNILEYKVPGLIFDTPDVGGNQAGLQRGFSARGTPNGQNVQLLNGVNVGDPAAIGFAMNYYDPSSFENIQVSSGAQDISMGTSGVTINMVTKSGTNVFAGQILQTYQGQGTQWDNIDTTLKKAGFRPDANAVAYITNTNGQAGGPMLRNRLFYFGSLNYQPTHVNVPGFPAVAPPQVPTLLADTSNQDTTDITTGTGRLTYQLNGSNRFDIYGSKQRYDKPNRGANATTTQDSNSKEYDIDNVGQVLWNWVLTDRLFANTNLSYNNVHFPLSQKTSLQPLTDNSTGILLRNRTSTANMFRRRLELNSNWQYFVPSFIGGRHEIKGGVSHGYTPEDVTTTRVDNVTLTFRSLQGTASQPPGPVNVTVFNSPTFIKRAVTNTSLYVQDSFAVGRLTAIAGVRWERVEGFIPPQVHPSSDYFPSGTTISGLNVTLNTGGVLTQYVVRDSFDRVDNAPLWKNWAPRFSGTYDLTGKGRSVVKVSWGKYLDQIGTGTPGPNPNGTVSQQYAWVDGNSDLVFQRGNATWDGFKYVGGEFGALQSTSIPNPNPFDPTLERTWRNETTVGIDHELFAGVRGSATFIHRREKNAQGTVDQSLELWPSQFTEISVREPGRDGRFGTGDDIGADGLAGTADDLRLTVFNRNPGVTQVTKTVNDERLGTTYKGLELVVTKRYANGFALLGGYTYSHTTVELTSLANPNAAFVNAQGEFGGRRHLFKATGSYILPYQISVGANLRMQSGLPITRTFSVPGCSASVTTDCLGQGATTVNAEPRGSTTLPGIYTIDTRVGRFFNIGRQRFELSMDAYNLTNANTVYEVRQGSTETAVRDYTQPGNPPPTVSIPTFMSPTGALGPRILRFNVTYWFR